MSLWIKNAKIATMNDELPEASSAVVIGDFFAYVGDEAGAAALTFETEGTYVISASSETTTLVAPVCIVTVTAE